MESKMSPEDIDALSCSPQASPAELATCSLLHTENVLKNSVFLNFSEAYKIEFLNTLSPLAKLALVLVEKGLTWVLDISEFDSLSIRAYRHSDFYVETCEFESDSFSFHSVFKREGCIRFDFSSNFLDCFRDGNNRKILNVLRATELPLLLESDCLPEQLKFGRCFEKDMEEEHFDCHLLRGNDGMSRLDDESFDSLIKSLQTLLESSVDREDAIDFISSKDCDDWDAIHEAIILDDSSVLANFTKIFNISDLESLQSMVQEIIEFFPFDIGASSIKSFLSNLDSFEDPCREAWEHEIVDDSPIYNYLNDGKSQQFTWEISDICLENSNSGQKLTIL